MIAVGAKKLNKARSERNFSLLAFANLELKPLDAKKKKKKKK